MMAAAEPMVAAMIAFKHITAHWGISEAIASVRIG